MTNRTHVTGWLSALIAAVLLLAGTATPALAAVGQNGIDPNATTELVIHKLFQPQQIGDPATGLEDPSVTGDPVAGVTFSAKRVPGIDLTTGAGWDEARALTISEAAAATHSQPVAAERTTDGEGLAVLDLEVGLYYIEEIAAPANVVPSAPFLVTLPLPHPASPTWEWMYTVHVYPKNTAVDAAISVNDVDAVTCGDAVQWQSRTTIPHQPVIGEYIVQNIIAPGTVLPVDLSQVKVDLTGSTSELLPSDYTVAVAQIDGRDALVVTFTGEGRGKLASARADDPQASVTVSYPTTVTATGHLQNEVRLLAGNFGLVDAVTETRFGPLKIRVHEKDKTKNVIEGAVFELYLTPEDAAARRNPIVVGGKTQWTTGKDGMITIGCLRYSDFVNGGDIPKSDPDFRYYYAQPVSYPAGWVGDMDPLAGIVNTTVESEAVVLDFVVRPPGPPEPPGPGPKPTPKPDPNLPKTGAQLAGVGLLAAALLGGGAMLLGRRRRANGGDETTASETQ